MNYIAEIEGRVAGIPCIIAVTDYEKYIPAYTSGRPEDCYPSEGGCGEWELLDRRGRRAQWLERKVNDDRDIQQQIFDHFEG